MFKKIFTTTLTLFLIFVNPVFAANTKSIDLELDNSQYLSITNANQTGLDITGDMTLEGWIKLESNTADRTLLSKWAGSGGISYRILVKSDRVLLQIYDGSTVASASWSVTINNDTWYHIAITYDASAGSASLYLDGSFESTITGLVTSIYNSTAPFLIGANGVTGFEAYWDGLIDEVRVWNDIRTGTEISDNYQKELVGNETNLQGYWKLNNSLLDETSNDNDLTNNNSATFSTDVPFSGSTPATTRRVMFIN